MQIGETYLYKNKHYVFVTDGSFERNSGISNFWDFKYIKKDGTLGKGGSDYDNEDGKFIPVKSEIIVKIIGEGVTHAREKY